MKQHTDEQTAITHYYSIIKLSQKVTITTPLLHRSIDLFTVLHPTQEFFTYRDVSITGEGLQNLGL
jgi:hypothetical protein